MNVIIVPDSPETGKAGETESIPIVPLDQVTLGESARLLADTVWATLRLPQGQEPDDDLRYSWERALELERLAWAPGRRLARFPWPAPVEAVLGLALVALDFWSESSEEDRAELWDELAGKLTKLGYPPPGWNLADWRAIWTAAPLVAELLTAHAAGKAKGVKAAQQKLADAGIPVRISLSNLETLRRTFFDQFTHERLEIVAVEKIGRVRGVFKLVLKNGIKITLGPISKLTPANVRDAVEDATEASLPMYKKGWPKIRNSIVRAAEIRDIGSLTEDVAGWVSLFVNQCGGYATDSEHPRGSAEWENEKFPQFGQRQKTAALFGADGELLLHWPSFWQFIMWHNRDARQAEVKDALIVLGFRGGDDAFRLRWAGKNQRRSTTRAWVNPNGWDQDPEPMGESCEV